MSKKYWPRKAAESVWLDMCRRSGMDHSEIEQDKETFEEIMHEWSAIIELAKAMNDAKTI